MQAARLEDRAVLALSGPDVRPFLQGLITNDIEKVKPGKAIYAALLTPQGKILFDFILAEGDGALLLDCAANTLNALIKRLKLYRLRAKVEIEPRDQLGVYVGLTGRAAERGNGFADPRLAELGPRFISAVAEMPEHIGTAENYHEWRLRLGVPESGDFGSDKVFALDAGLDELHAVSFTKGCYVGQELTARMKHRGTARKRVLPVEGHALPDQGVLMAGGKDIGEMLSSYGDKGFALVRLDRLDEAKDADIFLDGKTVALKKPEWLSP
jgi:folate-binding protein YgfZ